MIYTFRVRFGLARQGQARLGWGFISPQGAEIPSWERGCVMSDIETVEDERVARALTMIAGLTLIIVGLVLNMVLTTPAVEGCGL